MEETSLKNTLWVIFYGDVLASNVRTQKQEEDNHVIVEDIIDEACPSVASPLDLQRRQYKDHGEGQRDAVVKGRTYDVIIAHICQHTLNEVAYC